MKYDITSMPDAQRKLLLRLYNMRDGAGNIAIKDGATAMKDSPAAYQQLCDRGLIQQYHLGVAFGRPDTFTVEGQAWVKAIFDDMNTLS